MFTARSLIIVLLSFFLFATPVAGDTPPPTSAADRAAIEDTISRQIEAFQRNDGEAAFAFADPGIRARFGDPETFMEMVRGGYLPVCRPQNARFLDLEDVDGDIVQSLLVVGPDRAPYFAYCTMRQQADGSSRIGRVHLVRAEDEET